MQKLSNLIMIICLAGWCAWIATGGNMGDMERTVNGTLVAAVVGGAAFCIKMIGRATHGDH